MALSLELVPRSKKKVIREMMQFYLYDFTYYLNIELNDKGRFPEYPDLDEFWSRPGRKFPYLIYSDYRIAGFALVDRLGTGEAADYYMTEFFVLHKYRRAGVGKWAAHQLFDRYSGRWKVTQVSTNIPAQTFWRRIIGEYTSGNYREQLELDHGGPSQYFDSSRMM
ncbi:GNAT family N-acetyltransferase [Paenibacillus sp. WLX1005]|uniref:GNAT family N-acetyltransferase n=1 Tax=Paenibacillus sp. WLX1005 TaxID=3243766 RepID=UPI00398436FB